MKNEEAVFLQANFVIPFFVLMCMLIILSNIHNPLNLMMVEYLK